MVILYRVLGVIFLLFSLLFFAVKPLIGILFLIYSLYLIVKAPAIVEKSQRLKAEKAEKKNTTKSAAPAPVENSAPAPAPSVPAPASKVENFHVAGLFYHMNEFMELAEDNPFYSTKKADLIEDFLENEYVFKYDFSPALVELIPEPDNEHDPNAVAVYADKHLIGYIKAGNCSHVKKLLAAGTIQKIDLNVWGGPYVYLNTDENRLEKGERDYKVKVVVTLTE